MQILTKPLSWVGLSQCKSDTTHRLHNRHESWEIDLRPEMVHVDIDYIRLRIKELIPDPLDDDRLAYRPGRCHHQQLQQRKLAVSKFDYFSSSTGLVGDEI